MKAISQIFVEHILSQRAKLEVYENSVARFMEAEGTKPDITFIDSEHVFHYFNSESERSIIENGLMPAKALPEESFQRKFAQIAYPDQSEEKTHPNYIWLTDMDYRNIWYVPPFLWASKRMLFGKIGRERNYSIFYPGFSRIIIRKSEKLKTWHGYMRPHEEQLRESWYTSQDTVHAKEWAGLQRFSIQNNRWEDVQRSEYISHHT
jgi:hypothetical protein